MTALGELPPADGEDSAHRLIVMRGYLVVAAGLVLAPHRTAGGRRRPIEAAQSAHVANGVATAMNNLHRKRRDLDLAVAGGCEFF